MNEEKDKTITDPEEVGREGRAQRQTANTTPEPVATTTANETAKPGKYAFLYEQTAEKPMSESDLEKMAKREKRNMRFAKISDALRALAGTSGKKPSMVQTVSDRYNLMRDKDREARMRYNTGLMNARMADDRDAMAQKTFDFKLTQHKDEQERQAKEQERQAKLDRERADDKKKEWEWRNKTFDENKRQADRSFGQQVKQHNDNIDLRGKEIEATRARGVRGKQLGFADGKGNQVSIYENVWKGSMQQVYDAMLSDLVPANEEERKRWVRQMNKLDTPQKKEDYVKQNWHRSPKASQIMLTLSGIDPATMTSELNDEDYSQYEQGEEEDYSQYEVK